MRTLVDIFAQAVSTLWAHKLRSFLTMFGIAWGVGSLLLLIGLGEGFRTGQRENLATIGQDVLFMFPGRIPNVPGQHTSQRPYFLTFSDYEAIRDEARHVRNVTPLLTRGDIRAQSDFGSANGQTFGVLPNIAEIRFLPIKTGRWLNDRDIAEKHNVACIGLEMVKSLFPGEPAVGNHILLNGLRFEVIGVIDNVGGKREDSPRNAAVYIPISIMQDTFPNKNTDVYGAISFINYQPRTREEHEVARDEVRRIIARRHGFDYHNTDAFEDWDTIETEKMVGKIFDAMDLFLGGVGLVTLALGAIGIINIMLVSVSERTREIGLRKALGATRRNILLQFFFDGLILTAISGGVGVGVASALMAALAKLPSPPGFDSPRLVPASAAIAIGALGLAAIASGLYPASKAAQLEPVEALRQE